MSTTGKAIHEQRQVLAVYPTDTLQQFVARTLRHVVVASSVTEGGNGRGKGEPDQSQVVSPGKFGPCGGANQSLTIAIVSRAQNQDGLGSPDGLDKMKLGASHVRNGLHRKRLDFFSRLEGVEKTHDQTKKWEQEFQLKRDADDENGLERFSHLVVDCGPRGLRAESHLTVWVLAREVRKTATVNMMRTCRLRTAIPNA